MYDLINIEIPTRAIVHLKEEESRAGVRLVHYQVLIDTKGRNVSPSGDYVRFNHGDDCELHGWFKLSSIVIDELLEEMIEQAEVANG
jgi:hypothetical protein